MKRIQSLKIVVMYSVLISLPQIAHAKNVQVYSKRHHQWFSTGALADDPAKMRKVPHAKVLKKDASLAAPADGESLIPIAALPSLPTTVEMDTPPVANQGSEGSCVSFAVAYAARSIEEHYRTGIPYGAVGNIFSPEFLYNLTKSGSCSGGSSSLSALNTLVSVGVSTWATMPYSSSNGCDTMPNAEQSSEAALFKIASYSQVGTADQLTMKTMLTNHHPLLLMVAVDDSFYNAGPGFIWKSYTSSAYALHEITIVGYDDSLHAYKVMNSWGTSWGDRGFSWIDYDFLPTSVQTTALAMSVSPATDVVPPQVQMSAPFDGASVSGSTSLLAFASDNMGVASVRFRVDGVTVGTAVTRSPYAMTLDASSLSAGDHYVTAVASDTSGNLSTSAPVAIHVGVAAPVGIEVTSPAYGATLSGVVSLSANMLDGLANYPTITFMMAKLTDPISPEGYPVSGATIMLGSDSSAPYAITWDSRGVPDGDYLLTAQYISNDYAHIGRTRSIVHVSNGIVPVQSPTPVPTVSPTPSPTPVPTVSPTPTPMPTPVPTPMPSPTPVKDTQAPVVSIQSPSNGVQLSTKNFRVVASGTDNVGVVSSSLLLDGSQVGTASGASLNLQLNPRKWGRGAHTLTVQMRDAAGNVGSASVTVYR